VGVIDSATWFTLALTLTVIGAVSTWLLWRRRGMASGLRALAFTLLPFAAYLTGTLRLVGRIVSAIGSWAVNFVFSPVVWLGVAMAGVSAVLFVLSSAVRRRSPGASKRSKAPKPAEVTGTSSRAPAGQPAIQDDDMDDIAAILKKHGIS
jgi:hypothetical protein